MKRDDFPAPREGIVLTHFLTVKDQDHSRAFYADVLSIVVMETAEVLVEVYTPGVMEAGLGAPIFWYGMLLALTAGFLAAFPVNYILVGKGIGHHH